MFDLVPPGTDRVAFREWNEEDINSFHAICSDPEVMRFVGDGQAWTRDRTARFIQSARELLQEKGYCQWALIHKADGKLLGYCGFVSTGGTPEVGWRLAPEYWGQGLATEAAKAVLKHGFETLGFQRVTATVQAANVASIRVIEKLAMTPAGSFDRNGREVLLYSADAGCVAW